MRNTRDEERDYQDSKGNWYHTIRVAVALNKFMMGRVGYGWQTSDGAIHSYGIEQLHANYGTEG